MTPKGQILVALVAAAAGFIALAVFWLIASPEVTRESVAIATLVYAAAYVPTVPRAKRWLRRNPDLTATVAEPTHY